MDGTLKKLLEQHKAHRRRNRDLDLDPVLGFQAEHTMVRIEKAIRADFSADCVTCGDPIPEARRRACPEAVWCVDCSTEYERKRGKPWTKDQHYGKRY